MTGIPTGRAIVGLLTVAALLAPPSVGAGEPPSAPGGTVIEMAPGVEHRREAHPRLDGRLVALSRNPDRGIPGRAPSVYGFDPRTDRVVIEVYALDGKGAAVEVALNARGATGVVRFEDAIVAEVPVGALTVLGEDSRIGWISATAIPHAEGTGEGVGAIAAAAWHDAGITGAGIKIAVIDLGFGGYESLLGTELPAKVHTFDTCGGMGAPEDHGTAVAEIVHEVAPHATLYLMCIEDTGDLAAAVDHAIDQGVTVISHSVGWLNTGRGDGTGPFMGSILETARDNGILWVNSAGNYAEQHWGGTFDGPNGAFHDFGGGDETITFTLAAGKTVTAYLKWDDWPTSSNDYDLYLYGGPVEPACAPSGASACSIDEQSGTQLPTESLQYTHPGPGAGTFHLKISRFSAPGTPPMDLFVLGDVAVPIEHNDPDRSLNDLAGSPIILAAGAFCFENGPFCASSGAVESFSSRGPNINGLVKPDLAAPDGVSSGSLGLFFGTSAAAPHTSGAAALLQEAEGLCSPVALHLLMLGQTEAVGDPVPNNDYGHGRLLLDSPPTPPDPVIRYAGANRYATAAQTSQADFPCGARTVFVATGENFPDALAAAAVAGSFNAPILLVQANSVPKATSDELARLDPDQIVILGGTAVVSAAVATALAGHAPVTRLAGSNRYATAVEVSKFAFPVPAAVTDVFVATGTGFADALAGGPAGAYLGGPVLLVEPNALPVVTATEIQRLGPQRVWVLGGPAAVSNAVVAQIEGLGFTTIRVSGANRYATAVEVSRLVFLGPTAETDGSIVHRVYIAVGTNFPDAVAGGGVAGLRFAPVLLVEANSIAQVVTDEVTRLNPRQIVILGGTAVVSTAVEVALEALI